MRNKIAILCVAWTAACSPLGVTKKAPTVRTSSPASGGGGESQPPVVVDPPGEVRLTAQRFYDPTRFVDAVQRLDSVRTLRLPFEIPVVRGQSANDWLKLSVDRGEGSDGLSCYYHGTGHSWTSYRCAGNGTQFTFWFCALDSEVERFCATDLMRCAVDPGVRYPVRAGDGLHVRGLKLRLQHADASCGVNEVQFSAQLDH